jgi:NAD-dependent DNA ligase
MSKSKESELKKYNLDEIKENPLKFAKDTTIANGIAFLKLANYFYYKTDKPIVSDSVYDKIEDALKERSPKNKYWSEIRESSATDIAIDISTPDASKEGIKIMEKSKVKLPYWMGSMDKIKPGKEQIEKWSVKYPGVYVISEKLDGMSCLLVYEQKTSEMKLYSRGDGSVGQDITGLLKYIKCAKLNIKASELDSGILALRGELIITKDKFDEKYKDIKNDPRSMVAGLMNAKNVDASELKDLDLVIYEIIEPAKITPSAQFEMIESLGFKTPRNEILKVKTLKEDDLMTMLQKWKKESKYEIDGLIITQDRPQERNTDGNPDYSRAFKMDLDEQRGVSEVEEILWEVSRHGKIIPRIKIKPLKIGGITIQKATAFNAKYIVDNKLGPGAVVNIIRSGDVIPYIESVVKPAPKGASLPEDIKYKWHSGGYDIYIDDEDNESDEIEIKKLSYFMSTLEADGISGSTIKRYYEAGFKTIKSILNMTMEDLLKLPNTQTKLATKQLLVLEHIKTNEYALDLLMAASGAFGLGMGSRKVKLVIDTYPDLMTRNITKSDLIKIAGFEEKTAEIFLSGLEKFKKWVIENKLYYTDPLKKINEKKENGKLDGMIIVMTGFRDKLLEEIIVSENGSIIGSVSSKTNILLAKDINEDGAKIQKARSLKIPIMTSEEFKKKFNL